MTVAAEGVLRYTQKELIEALEARRQWAERLDATHLAAHRAAEKKALQDFRAKCREAIRWDYPTLKKEMFRVSVDQRPYCPLSVVTSLNATIRVVKASRQARFTIASTGTWHRAFYLLTHDENAKVEMC